MNCSCALWRCVAAISVPLLVLPVCPVSGWSADGSASRSTLRCGNDLVSLGDSVEDVLVSCGEPSRRHTAGSGGKTRTAKRKSSRESDGDRNNESPSRKKKRTPRRAKYQENEAETWHYNRGPNDFVYCLHFEDGVLTRIVQGGRGR